MCPALHPVPAPFTRCSPHQPQTTSDSFTATKLLLSAKSAEASYKASFVISTHFLSLLSVVQQRAYLSVTAGFCLSSNRRKRVTKITADIHDRGLITACISVQIIDTQVWETEHPCSTQLSWPNYLLQKTNTRDTEERGQAFQWTYVTHKGLPWCKIFKVHTYSHLLYYLKLGSVALKRIHFFVNLSTGLDI